MSAMVSSLLVSWGCGQWGLLSWVWSWNITEVQMFSSFGWNFVLVWSLVNCTWTALLADFPSVLSVFLWFFPLSSSWPILERTSLKDLSPSFSFIKYMFSLEKQNKTVFIPIVPYSGGSIPHFCLCFYSHSFCSDPLNVAGSSGHQITAAVATRCQPWVFLMALLTCAKESWPHPAMCLQPPFSIKCYILLSLMNL